MSRYVSYRDFDWVLLGFVLLICGMGVMEIHSATMHTKFAGAHIKQVYWVLAGVGAMFVMSLVNYQALLEQIHWFYIAGVGSLMGVMVFGSVSHDLRAPLRHIDGFADLLMRQSRAVLDDKGRGYLDAISSSAKSMGQLIDDLLAFSRMGRTQMQQASVDLSELVDEVRQQLREVD